MNSFSTAASCPACSATDMREKIEIETFPFGEDRVEISVSVPVIRCGQCSFAYTDQRAEDLRHAAVCAHMGLLTPKEIHHVRKRVLNMSREAFHAAYGLSSASVERWENGKLFQNEAADTLIRALEDPAIARRLDRRTATTAQSSAPKANDNVVWGRFPSLNRTPSRAQDALERSRGFNLRIQAS